MKQIYINNFLKECSDRFIKRNANFLKRESIFEAENGQNINFKRSPSSQGQDSTLTPVSLESRPQNRRSQQEQVTLDSKATSKLMRIKTAQPSQGKMDEKIEEMGFGNNIMITELSENILEKEEKPPTFELMFQIHYTETGFINMPIETYFRPKLSEQGELSSPSNHKREQLKSLTPVDLSEPVFIGRLTSKFLFERACQVLDSNYRTKSFIQKNNYHPQSLATLNASSEGIDYLLTQPEAKLVDFLYSSYNTHLNDQAEINMFKMSIGAQSRAARQEVGGFQPKLKLKIAFEDKSFIEEKEKKGKENRRKEHFTVGDFSIIKVLGEGAFAKVLMVR